MANKFVIGGGWTVSQWDTRELVKFGHVIGVNDAALWTNVHAALTMDRLWFENRWPYLRARRVAETYVRAKCDCNVPRKTKRDNWQTFEHFNKPFPSTKVGELNGGNSGTCAINLAFQHMEEGDHLFLLGFDMCRGPGNEPYWYPAYPWANPDGATKKGHFDTWAKDMAGFANYAQHHKLTVYNVTSGSALMCYPKISFKQMMEILE